MFHVAVCETKFSSAATLAQLTALTDTVLTTRGNDLIATDDFRLGLAYGLGSSITELRANWPTLNAYGYHQFHKYDIQGTTDPLPPDLPALIDYMSQPIVVPKDEQLDIQISNSPGTTEQDLLALWLFTPGHQLTIPTGVQRIALRATYTFTPGTAYVWSGAQDLTFETTFRGGWYYVVGMDVIDPHALVARLIFPKNTPYNGRVLRPGCIVRQTTTTRPADRFMGRLGVYGFFNSFELPYIEIVSTNASAHTSIPCVFDVVYMGDSAVPGQLT